VLVLHCWLLVAPLVERQEAPAPEAGVDTVNACVCTPPPLQGAALQADQPLHDPTQSIAGAQAAVVHACDLVEGSVQAVPPLDS